jgi:serine/threonine protein kinase
MHQLQVAHMDLKKKDNLLVTADDKPCLIDFGAAVIKKPGFHPLNAFWFNLAKRFDFNAWVKQKYHNNMHNLSGEDRKYYQRTFIEKISSSVKKLYKKLS